MESEGVRGVRSNSRLRRRSSVRPFVRVYRRSQGHLCSFFPFFFTAVRDKMTAKVKAAAAAQGISASAYSQERRQLVSLIDQLRSAGASTEIDLPR